MTKRYKAKIGKRKLCKAINQYFVRVTCDGCGHSDLLKLRGWDAVLCSACKAELYKDGTYVEVAEAFREFAAGTLEKWATYSIAFSAMDRSGITLDEIKIIAFREAKIGPAIIENRRANWLGMGAA